MNDEVKNKKKQETRFLIVSVIAVAVLIVGVIGASYAYFAAYVSGTVSTTGTITTKTVDNCLGKTLTATSTSTANQTNFAKGQGNRVASVSGNVMMYARSDADAKCCYTAKLVVNASTFNYINPANGAAATSGLPEMVVVIKRNGTSLMTADVTGKNNTFYLNGTANNGAGTAIGSNANLLNTVSLTVTGLSTTKNTYSYDNWSLDLMFVNNNYVQNLNAGKSATASLTLTPTKTVLSSASC